MNDDRETIPMREMARIREERLREKERLLGELDRYLAGIRSSDRVLVAA